MIFDELLDYDSGVFLWHSERVHEELQHKEPLS